MIQSLSRTRNKVYLSIVLTVFYFLLVLPFWEAIAFKVPVTSARGLQVSSFLKLLFAPVLAAIFYGLITFAQQLKQKNGFYLTWAKVATIYITILGILFILLYPGYWVYDEFYTLEAAQSYLTYPSWQNYLTTIYHTFSLYLIPSGVGIVIVQLITSSLVVGYVVANLRQHLVNKRLAYLLIIPFLFIPVLLNNFYPLRLTFYSYIEVLVIAKLLFWLVFRHMPTSPWRDMFTYTLLISLLGLWRAEGAYYFLLLPFIFYKLGLAKTTQIKGGQAKSWIALCIACIALLAGIVHKTSVPRYQLPVSVNPLSTMLQKPLRGAAINENLQSIDKVISISELKKYPSYTDVTAMWNGGLKPDHEAHIKEYNKAFLYIILHNPKAYLDNRAKTFLYTNGFGNVPPFIHGGMSARYSKVSDASLAETRFEQSNIAAKPLNDKVRKKTIQLLLLYDGQNKQTLSSRIVWSAIPTMALLAILTVVLLIKRRYMLVFLSLVVLTRVPLLFLTAPANFFMYYLPIYLTGNFILCALFLIHLDKLHLKNRVKASIR